MSSTVTVMIGFAVDVCSTNWSHVYVAVAVIAVGMNDAIITNSSFQPFVLYI
jgi:hypothetical protein